MKKTKPIPRPITKSNKLFDAVNALLAKRGPNGKPLMVRAGSNFMTYPELIAGPEKENFVKNLFYYLRLKGFISEHGTMYIKDIEDGSTIAEYSNKYGAILVNNQV
ncbi:MULTISPECIES: hypothetical protein [Olivibacter]|uniref:Uncharacterized protein n=1 Tax=Olivibacter jilunii TaxID=985016 RepID=A0ABW6B4F6_9SPHI